jgi:large subunit ribosomal protein L30
MKLAIRQRKSAIGRARKQQRTLHALGIRRMHQEVLHKDTPQIRGMIRSISHLLEVEEIVNG